MAKTEDRRVYKISAYMKVFSVYRLVTGFLTYFFLGIDFTTYLYSVAVIDYLTQRLAGFDFKKYVGYEDFW